MIIDIGDGFRSIVSEIVSEHNLESEWVEIESSDMFQSEHFNGGFDATEMAFTFSYYDPQSNEYWFQLALDEIVQIADGKLAQIEVRPAG